MSADFKFRKDAVASLTREIGVYALCDLDNVPVYVGQSKDGIRQRVQRHLTSARSDIIANRQIDIWEIAYVWEYPVAKKEELDFLETKLFYHFNEESRLMNGTTPTKPDTIEDAQLVEHFVGVKNSQQITEAMDAHFERLTKYHRMLLSSIDASK